MEGLSANEKTIWTCWDAKTPREVVREAATKGTLIKLAHKYLMYKNSWDETQAAEWFQSEVFTWVLQLLERKQIHKARHTLEKTQIQPEKHFLKIALEAKEIEFRDYIIEQLQKVQDKLCSTEWNNFIKNWNLLRYLEKSFEKDGTFKQNKAFGQGKDMIVVTESEIKDMTVESIAKYSNEWKSKIAAHMFFDSFEFSLLDYLTPKAMWSHLLEQNKAMVLIRWINMCMSELVRDKNARYSFFTNENFVERLQKVDAKGLTIEKLQEFDEYFVKWPIDNEMIDMVASKHCFSYTKMCVYDTLSSFGILVEGEKRNLHEIISRLARTRNLKMIDVIFNESCATMKRSDFYIELAKYCLSNKQYNAFTCCVDCTVLDKNNLDVENEIKDCIELWLLFKSIEQTSDRQSHVLPIYKTCEQIAKDNIGDYICNNPYLVLGMILLDEKKSLFDIFTEDNILKFDDFELPLECSFDNKMTHLKNVSIAYKNNNLNSEIDVTVYQLLSGYRGLDVSKILQFQLMNHRPKSVQLDKADRRSLGSLISNDIRLEASAPVVSKPVEMPHFANKSLMNKYGYVAKLNHIYYLKQCRPCSASKAFLTYEYQHYNRLHEKSIKGGCSEAHALALQHWNDPTLTASAISFISMIGCNATRCRIHISAANMIKNHMIQTENKTAEQAVAYVNEIISKLSQDDNSIALEMLTLLEKITIHNIYSKNNSVEPNMPLIIYEWQTAIKFAILQNLPLPVKQLKEFVTCDLWFPFLLFADIFRYPQSQMLELSRMFKSKPLAEHLKHIIVHRNLDEIGLGDKDVSKATKEARERRASRLNSNELSPTTNVPFEFPDFLSSCDDLWEALTTCHSQEDPPSAMLSAAISMQTPLLALVATCYEPEASGVCWAYWILSTLGEAVPKHIKENLHLDTSDKNPREEDIYRLCCTCLETGYVKTLHESMLVFFPDSPLTTFTSFLCKTVWQLSFEPETTKMVYMFNQYCQRKYSSSYSDKHIPNAFLRRLSLQKISVALVQITLERSFNNAYHQKEFLRCLVDAQFGKDFIESTPEYNVLYMLLQTAMETSLTLDFKLIFDECANVNYLSNCLLTLIKESKFELALKFARYSHLPSDDAMTAEWTEKWNEIAENSDDIVDEKERLLYLARCSEAFKMANVSFETASEFIQEHIKRLENPAQKFYAYRLLLSWFNDSKRFDTNREEIEHSMWDCYFAIAENAHDVYLGTYNSTINFIMNKQKEFEDKSFTDETDCPRFEKLLAEIEIESDVENIKIVTILSDNPVIERWRKVLTRLLEKRLIEEAFRLSKLYNVVEEMHSRSICPCLLVKTCLMLAEGSLSPYDIPHNLRLLISSPSRRERLSGSETSVASFEELVIINEKSEDSSEMSSAQLAGREDADRLSALESLSSRCSIDLAKQVASYYRISLQIGWSYTQLLKYRGNTLDFISYLTGRSRMSLANTVFKTYNIPSKQIAEYLSLELVSATISPHLTKTSSLRQKEHFHYTLWGYPLNSHMQMFLNLRPEACPLIGRGILDHLMAFGKIYRANIISKSEIDDTSLDVDTIINEEYQTVEVDTITVTTTETTETNSSMETESMYSDATTVYSYATRMPKESRRNLFDVISKCNVHIPYEVRCNVKKITKGAKLSSKQVNIISIELLVLAHDAFSSACDTEGIAVVLRSAQALSSRLLQAKSWRLLARLLTGLARYIEMAYVFQMLMENDQFEFLLGQFDYMLGQQEDKIAEFKQGLLDYLRTHRPADTETYCMVAHHFNMYSEAADVKVKQAQDLICSLCKMASNEGGDSWLPCNNNTTLLLETAIQHYTDASEWYVRGGALSSARNAAGGAGRAALQLALLSKTGNARTGHHSQCVNVLASNTVSQTLFGKIGFMEGLVLCQMTDGHTRGWRDLAYTRLTANDVEYARSLAANRPDLAMVLIEKHLADEKDVVLNTAFKEIQTILK